MRKGFTLIELLVVIGIMAVIAVVLVLTLNPTELLKQARDANRTSDLATINKALAIYDTQTRGLGSMGSSSVVSVSIPDSSSTCANLGLPSLPSGWAYRCVSAANLYNIDGTGWIPVNFTSIGSENPLSKLPVDPTNTTSTGRFYTFVKGSWKVGAALESTKYQNLMRTDSGVDAARYEVGSSSTVGVAQTGMVAYYNFDEGSGTTVRELVTGTNNGSFTNGTTWVGSSLGTAARLDGVNDTVTLTNTDGSLKRTTPFTVSLWVQPSTLSNSTSILNGGVSYEFRLGWNRFLSFTVFQQTGGSPVTISTAGNIFEWNERFLLTGVYDGSQIHFYKNGTLLGSAAFTDTIHSATLTSVVLTTDTGPVIADDFRIYSYPMNATQVAALYNATR